MASPNNSFGPPSLLSSAPSPAESQSLSSHGDGSVALPSLLRSRSGCCVRHWPVFVDSAVALSFPIAWRYFPSLCLLQVCIGLDLVLRLHDEGWIHKQSSDIPRVDALLGHRRLDQARPESLPLHAAPAPDQSEHPC